MLFVHALRSRPLFCLRLSPTDEQMHIPLLNYIVRLAQPMTKVFFIYLNVKYILCLTAKTKSRKLMSRKL